MLNKNMLQFMPYLLAALSDMRVLERSVGGPQLSNNPGERFIGRSQTFRKNLRVVQKAQRHRAFLKSLRNKR